MRCFIGFYGLTRSLRRTADSIRTCFFEPLESAGFTTLRAGHFNLPGAITNVRSEESNLPVDRTESELLNLDLCWVEPQTGQTIAHLLKALRTRPDAFGDNYASLANLCHQLHSLERLWSLLELLGATEADLILLLRPDLLYLDPLNPAELTPLLENQADLIVPSWHDWNGLNDRFAFCTGRAAKIYATRIRLLAEECLLAGTIHAEIFLKSVAARHQLRVATTYLKAVRLRANGQIAARDMELLPPATQPQQAPAHNHAPSRPSLRVRLEIIDGFPRVSPLHGTPYLEFLAALHRRRQVRRYLEIGTQTGKSLACATGKSIAIDPAFMLDKSAWRTRPGVQLFEMTSDDFFAAHNPAALLGGAIELAFIDGMHLSEFVLRDFVNVERYCAKDSMIILHDALPQNFEMTERDRRPAARIDRALASAWTGDVWRVIPELRRARPDLCIEVLDCPPTGLVLITNLNPEWPPAPTPLGPITAELQAAPPTELAFWAFINAQPVTDSRTWLAEPQPAQLVPA